MAWEEVCLPKDKGGIGLIMTRDWNKVAMVRHLEYSQQKQRLYLGALGEATQPKGEFFLGY